MGLVTINSAMCWLQPQMYIEHKQCQAHEIEELTKTFMCVDCKETSNIDHNTNRTHKFGNAEDPVVMQLLQQAFNEYRKSSHTI